MGLQSPRDDTFFPKNAGQNVSSREGCVGLCGVRRAAAYSASSVQLPSAPTVITDGPALSGTVPE